MPVKIIGGVRHVLKRNIWYCRLCGEEVESKARHDFRSCSCGNLSVDGGISSGGTISWKEPDSIEDFRVWKPEG